MNKSILFTAVVIMVTLLACQKEATEKKTDINLAGTGIAVVTARLTNGAWKFTNVTLKYDNGDTDNGVLDICKSDDLYQYETNGNATVIYGSVSCGQDPVDGKFASWELIENATKLKEVYTRDMFGEIAGSSVIYNVDFISNNKLIISRTVTEAGKTYTEINTYTR